MSQALEKSAQQEASVSAFLHRQFRQRPIPVSQGTTLEHRLAILTGGNGGVGFEASRQLLKLGLSKLIITVRSQAKGDEAVRKLSDEFPQATIQAWLLDMESYESILSFVNRVRTLNKIDIVILNAGIQKSVFELNKHTKHEQTLQVNYLSTALLTMLLLPILKEKRSSAPKPPTLSIVASDTAYWAKLETTGAILPQYDEPRGFSSDHYQKSKLLLFWFIQKLSETVPSSVVTLNLCNPGMTTSTGLNDQMFSGFNPLLRAFATRMKDFVGRSIEDGGSNYIYATAVLGEESHGSFESDWTLKPYPLVVYGQTGEIIKERLWDETMKELDFADVANIVKGVSV